MSECQLILISHQLKNQDCNKTYKINKPTFQDFSSSKDIQEDIELKIFRYIIKPKVSKLKYGIIPWRYQQFDLMRQSSQILAYIREIIYEYDQIKYAVKPSPDGIQITIDDLPLQTRFVSNIPKTIYAQESLERPVEIYDCLVNQYIANFKLPKNMLSIEKSPKPTLLINLRYPGAPVRQLRYDVISQEILNPRLQSYHTTLSKMAEKVMKDFIQKYMKIVEQRLEKASESIQKKGNTFVKKIEQKGAEIIQLSQERLEKAIKQYRLQISKGIKDYKQHLEGDRASLGKAIHQRISLMLNEINLKMQGLQMGLLSCQQNQRQIQQTWYDNEFKIMQQIESIKDTLVQKVDMPTIQSLLQKLKNQKPPQRQPSMLDSTLITNLSNERNVGLEDFDEQKMNTIPFSESTKYALHQYKAQKTQLYDLDA